MNYYYHLNLGVCLGLNTFFFKLNFTFLRDPKLELLWHFCYVDLDLSIPRGKTELMFIPFS